MRGETFAIVYERNENICISNTTEKEHRNSEKYNVAADEFENLLACTQRTIYCTHQEEICCNTKPNDPYI